MIAGMNPVLDLDHDACYRALGTRDARFDGRLFVGVKTTGIYCRPICPARTPKRDELRVLRHAPPPRRRPASRLPALPPGDLAGRRGLARHVEHRVARRWR